MPSTKRKQREGFEQTAQNEAEKQQAQAKKQQARDDTRAAYKVLGLENGSLQHLEEHAHVEQGASVRLIVSILAIMHWMGQKLGGYSADTAIEDDMIMDVSRRIPSALHDAPLARPLKARPSSTKTRDTSGPSILTSWQALEKQRTERLAKLENGELTEAQFEKLNRENPLPKEVTSTYKSICDVLVHLVFDPLTYWQNTDPEEMRKKVNDIRVFLGLEPIGNDADGKRKMRKDYRERVLVRKEVVIDGKPVTVWGYPQKLGGDVLVVYYKEDVHIEHIPSHNKWTWSKDGSGKESRFLARLTPQGELKPVKGTFKPLMHVAGRRHGRSNVERVMRLMLDLKSGPEVAVDMLVDEDKWHKDFFNKANLEHLLDRFFSLDGKMGRERFTPRAKSTLMSLIWHLINSQLLSLYEVMAHCGRKTIKETDHAVAGAIGNKEEESGVYDDPLMKCLHAIDFLGKYPDLFTSEVFDMVKADVAALQASEGQGSSGN